MKTANRNKKIVTAAVFTAAVTAFIIWIWWGNVSVAVDVFSVPGAPRQFDGFRIAQVSDLHNAEFGEENGTLISLIREAEPDIIAVTGDLVDSNRTDIGTALSFIRAVVKLAPVYFVSGNHEAMISDGEFESLLSGLADAGVTVLDGASEDIIIGGGQIRLVGVRDPAFGPLALPDGLKDDSIYTVVLAHRPEFFAEYAAAGADIILSGHTHGGQLRLPFVGGVIAPGQGWFPKYDAGLFEENGARMIVSRGLGNSIIPVRINDRPELVIVELNEA